MDGWSDVGWMSSLQSNKPFQISIEQSRVIKEETEEKDSVHNYNQTEKLD